MSLYPNTRIELTEQWLSDIKILKNEINQRSIDKCDLPEEKGKRIINFIDRCCLEFELLEEWQYTNRIKALDGKVEYNDYLAWDDLNILRDFLVSYRINILEEKKICEFKILFDLAKSEAKSVSNSDVLEQLEEMEIGQITQNRGSMLTRLVSKLNTPTGEFICDKLCAIASSVSEGVTTAALNHLY